MNANFRKGRKYQFTLADDAECYISDKPLVYIGVIGGIYRFDWLDGSGNGQGCAKHWLKDGLVSFKEVK